MIGILARLHISALSELYPVGAWALTIIGITTISISLGYLIYNIRTEGRIRREMQQLLDEPTLIPGSPEDAKIIKDNRQRLQDRYFLLEGNQGLLKLDNKVGVLCTRGERMGDIILFVDTVARDAWISCNMPGYQLMTWDDLRKLPSNA